MPRGSLPNLKPERFSQAMCRVRRGLPRGSFRLRTSRSHGTSIVHCCLIDRAAKKHKVVNCETHQREQRKEYKPEGVGAECIFDEAEFERREESAQAAKRSDQSGDGSRFFREVLRDEFENCSVAEPEGRSTAESTDRERHDRVEAKQQREQSDGHKNKHEHFCTAKLVSQVAAERSEQSSEHDKPGRTGS